MIIINDQIVSPLLVDTLKKLQTPVLKEKRSDSVPEGLHTLHAADFFHSFTSAQKLLTNSESCLSVLNTYSPESKQNHWSKLLKDKGQLREILSKISPDYFYKVVSAAELMEIPIETIPFPVVLKPTLGYSSVGVYKVKSPEEWEPALHRLNLEFLFSKDLYNQHVINRDHILIEEWIQGEEYAIDGYFDEEGQPVILNMFKRLFKDEYDTSDRIYYTSKHVIKEIHKGALSFMKELGSLMPMKNYPIHFEVKKHKNLIMPIEINPLRFAGAGTTDLGYYAYGNNIYQQFFDGVSPDWENIIEKTDDAIYSFCCAEAPLSLSKPQIEKIDHEEFKKQFTHILEYREIQAENDQTFAIVFFKSENLDEAHAILHLDLQPYLHTSREKAFTIGSVL